MEIRLSPQTVPVAAEADVVVLGGGTTGVMAAIRAARLGMRVALIERNGCFGGNATAGMVCAWHTMQDFDFNERIIAGLSQETVERLDRRGALDLIDHTRADLPSRMWRISTYMFNSFELSVELDEMLREAGVVCLLHTLFSEPYLEDGALRGVIVDGKSGRQAVLGRFFIDATGDADLAFRLGVPSRSLPGRQPSTTAAVVSGYDRIDQPKRVLREHAAEFGLPALGWDRDFIGYPQAQLLLKTNVFEDCLTSEGLTRSEIEGRRQVRGMIDLLNRYGGGDRPVVLLGLSAAIGIREGRHMSLSYTLTGDDVLSGRRFEDAIANGSYPIDIHHADKPGCTFWYLNGMTEYELDGYPHEISWWKPKSDDYPRYWQIPYRSLLPREVKNLLVCGRALDADRRAYGAARVMINLNQTGEACGVAAALCLQKGLDNDDLPPALLRETLAAGGSVML